jgi:integrase
MAAKRRAPNDGTLFKNSRGYWVAGVEMPPGPDGKRRQRRIVRKDRNECLAELRRLQREVEAGTVATSPSTTVEAWLTLWAEKILPTRGLKPSTMYSYRTAVRLYLIPYLGRKRLGKLTPGDIREALAVVATKAGGRSAQKADQTLRLAIKAAIREGVISANVMDRIDKPSHHSREGVAFDSATAAHIIATAVTVQGPMWGARWALGFLTGARESEVLGLEWDRVGPDRVDISWQLNRQQKRHGCGVNEDGVYLCGKVRPSFCPKASWDFPPDLEWRPCVGTLVWTRPKSKAGQRLIPLVPALVDILDQLDRNNPYGLVFHQAGRPISQEQDQKAWKDLLIAAKVPHLPQHSIRHSTATLLLEAGVDTHVVQSVIGHSDIVTTRGYQHVSLDLAREAWATLSAIMPAGKS